MIELYTIGFTKKSAKEFFDLLQKNQVSKIVDTRISHNSQLAGFAKSRDLAFFAETIGGMGYLHEGDFAPTKDLLAQYRKKELSWEEYEVEYLNLLDMRKIGNKINVKEMHQNCLLCSEHSPEHCHRRLLAEYLQHKFTDIQVKHLM